MRKRENIHASSHYVKWHKEEISQTHMIGYLECKSENGMESNQNSVRDAIVSIVF